jgi:hypothetical protein
MLNTLIFRVIALTLYHDGIQAAVPVAKIVKGAKRGISAKGDERI